VPTWLEISDVLYFHQQCIDEFGGLSGKRYEGALESTLARPQNLLSYEPGTGVFALAASYGFGLARNHCFSDGNKRISLICMDVFLQLNGFELVANEADAVAVIKDLASGSLSEKELESWLDENSREFDIDAD
jgi:death-on-curing protein